MNFDLNFFLSSRKDLILSANSRSTHLTCYTTLSPPHCIHSLSLPPKEERAEKIILLTRDLPGECSGDIFRTLDFLPSGNTLIFSDEGVENLKALYCIYSVRKAPILGATVDTNISSI